MEMMQKQALYCTMFSAEFSTKTHLKTENDSLKLIETHLSTAHF